MLRGIRIHEQSGSQLFHIAHALDFFRLASRRVQCRQEHSRQNRDDGYTATLKMAFFLLFSAVFAFSFFDEKTLNTQIPNVTFRMIF